MQLPWCIYYVSVYKISLINAKLFYVLLKKKQNLYCLMTKNLIYMIMQKNSGRVLAVIFDKRSTVFEV